MMITRMIMSLKKAASSQRPHMSTELQTIPLPTKWQDTHTIHEEDGVPFSVFKNSIPGMSEVPLTCVGILP